MPENSDSNEQIKPATTHLSNRSIHSDSTNDDYSAQSAPSRFLLKRTNSNDALEKLAVENLSNCLFGITIIDDDDDEDDDDGDDDENDDGAIPEDNGNGDDQEQLSGEDVKLELECQSVNESKSTEEDESVPLREKSIYLTVPSQVDENNEGQGANDDVPGAIIDVQQKLKVKKRRKKRTIWNDSCRAEEWFSQPGLWRYKHHIIDLKQLRKIVTAGVVEEGSLRAVAWRVLFGYLPPDNAEWESVLQSKRRIYVDLVHNLFFDASDVDDGSALKGRRRRKSLVLDRQRAGSWDSGYSSSDSDGFHKQIGHPHKQQVPKQIIDYWIKIGRDVRSLERISENLNALKMNRFVDPENPATEEAFKDFFESATLLDEIHKDVVRTHPDLSFFLEPAADVGQRRYGAIERILFVWSKFNKGVRYVQGMNEIVGILYYVLANDQNDDWASHAEPDTYWLLHSLLSEMQDVFVPELDHAATGVQGRIQTMEALLARHDPEVKEHLDDLGLEVSFYAIRWWTTLLSREFLLPDTIRLWDSMFASTHKDNFLRYVCVTMIILVRYELMKGDFAKCLSLLQAYPSTHTDQLLEASRSLWLYESQVTIACHRAGITLHQALMTIRSPPALVMAFGFKKGKPASRTRAERAKIQAERAKSQAEHTVEMARKKVATSAQDMFGKALGFFRKSSQDFVDAATRARTRSEDVESSSRLVTQESLQVSDAVPLSPSNESDSSGKAGLRRSSTIDNADLGNLSVNKVFDEEDDIYLKAILNA